MSFWDVVWFIIISFAFIAYLMVMFSIISDLFRDRETSGWAKAVWFIALLFLPFVTALVYLIARGDGMARRHERSVVAMKEQQDSYIRDAAAQASPADEITQAQSLLDSGVITQDEFTTLKAKALA